MDSFMTTEWEDNCGINGDKVTDFLNNIEIQLKDKSYGSSISKIVMVMTCMARHFKQRKRYIKATKRFEYDILLDFFLIKNLGLEDKKKLIKYQMIKITEETFSKYKFEDFDKMAFLSDFKQIIETTEI